MHARARARLYGYTALGLLILAAGLLIVPEPPAPGEQDTWAIAGALVLHPALLAGLAGAFTYRNLDEIDKPSARIGPIALATVIVASIGLWLLAV